MANPGMSAWAALVKRAGMKAGETVLINGATGSAGQLAVQIARFLGARKVIACGRNVEKLAALGADETVNLSQDEADLRTQFAGLAAQQIDVVVDYLWGRSAELLLPALAKHSPEMRRYVLFRSVPFPPPISLSMARCYDPRRCS